MRLKGGRIVIGGTNSGCGKTTVACGILKALFDRGIKVSSFKVGPDYIDPMFHKRITGSKSSNLDSFLMSERGVLTSLCSKSGFFVIEGVMGYYDGIGANSIFSSTADIGNITKTPSVIVINPTGMALSAAAFLKGFIEFRENTIKAVILNNINPALLGYYREIIEKELKIEVLGCIPKDEGLSFKSRHLGLVTADEIVDIDDRIKRAGQLCEGYIDINRLIEIGNNAEDVEFEPVNIERVVEKAKIAAALDDAFCFYYEDNFDILKKTGCDIVSFSPLKDKALPDDICGIYIGGGYPELYLNELSKNSEMILSIRQAAKKNMPIYAECGGFMYLNKTIEDSDGKIYDMCGIFDSNCYWTGRLQNFGYHTLKANKDNMLLKAGKEVNAHEFHYFACDDEGECFSAKKPLKDKGHLCIVEKGSVIGGYPHINFYGNPNVAYSFAKTCERWKRNEN